MAVTARAWTDEDYRQAVAKSTTRQELCGALGEEPSAAAFQALRRAAARTGVSCSHLPIVGTERRRRRWTDEDLRAAVATSTSVSGVLRALGYRPSGGMHRYITGHLRHLDVDISHFTGASWNRGLRGGQGVSIPLENVLVRNSTYPSGKLRVRLIAAGLKPAHCERCRLAEWQGEPLPLHLDHINGDHTDHRIENLRVLCPNCHSQTDTWCHRNRRAGRPYDPEIRPA